MNRLDLLEDTPDQFPKSGVFVNGPRQQFEPNGAMRCTATIPIPPRGWSTSASRQGKRPRIVLARRLSQSNLTWESEPSKDEVTAWLQHGCAVVERKQE